MTVIRPAEFPRDTTIVRALFTEYAQWLAVDLSFQGFTDELASLPGKYAPPAGAIVLAGDQAVARGSANEAADRVLGCAAFRPLRGDTCEVKRLWVRPAARGRGLGRRLMTRIETDARNAGYSVAVLDTLDHMTAALTLYRSLGYTETEPYYHNPLPGAVYLRKSLRHPTMP